MHRRHVLAFVAVVLVVAGAASVTRAATDEIGIQDFDYRPTTLTVDVGDTVRWTNLDFTAHNVVGDGFVSANLANGRTFEHTFTTPGTFDYFCSIHPFMTGAVTVVDDGTGWDGHPDVVVGGGDASSYLMLQRLENLYNAAPGATAPSLVSGGSGDASGRGAHLAVVGASVPLVPLVPVLAIVALRARSGRRGR